MSDVKLPVFGIDRHRLFTDGEGVTTIVGTCGCPLQCKYCLNPQAGNPKTLERAAYLSPKELYDRVKVDNLYFLATGGGIVFGGGEPLSHADFFGAFRECCTDAWVLTVETSLNVEPEMLKTAIPVIDNYIIDIKDINPDIYRSYTGKSNERVMQNLEYLLEYKSVDHIWIRVPKIPGYNTEENIKESVRYIENLGIRKIEVFPYITDVKRLHEKAAGMH